MYKLIIGNVRVNVSDDNISRTQAVNAARQAILDAVNQNKLLSSVEISRLGDELEVNTIERTGAKLLRKSLKQSMLDGILTAACEKLSPSDGFSLKDAWFDNDTSQEWHGSDVINIRDELINKLEEWIKNV